MSVLDIVGEWLKSGPGTPTYAPMVSGGSVVREFGDIDPLTNRMSDALSVALSGGARIQAPTNGLLRYVPNLKSLSEEKRAAFAAAWPGLRRYDGLAFGPGEQAEGNLLFEVWPTAFMRLEHLFASVEGPTSSNLPQMPVPSSSEQNSLPQMPVPRWFWLGGIAQSELEACLNDIVATQFKQPKSLGGFFQGEWPVYVEAGQALSKEFGIPVDIRAFDSGGLLVDPLCILGRFALLADGGIAEMFALAEANELTLKASPRHVLVFSDHRGRPFEPWKDSPNDPGPSINEFTLKPSGMPGVITDEIPFGRGVVIFKEGMADGHWKELRDNLVTLTVHGQHTRVGLHPHGFLDKNVKISFDTWSFARVRVIDYARWFPLNLNEKNEFQRYTEKNELEPLINGKPLFRSTYRAMRATYRQETYASLDDMPEGTPLPPDQTQKGCIFLANWNISPDNMLLGRRSMLRTSRTQPGAEPPADFISRLKFVSAPPPDKDKQRAWWLVTPPGTLPPGSYVELQPLDFGDTFVADDPRIPGKDVGADLYGVVVPSRPVLSCFTNEDGQCFLPINYQTGWNRAAELRVVTWEPDEGDAKPDTAQTSGKGRMKTRPYGKITVPQPADPFSPPLDSAWGPLRSFGLFWEGVPGEVFVVLGAGTLVQETVVVVINQRTGDVVKRIVTAAELSGEIKIKLWNFARADLALIGLLPPGAADPSDCKHFFTAQTTDMAKLSGFAPAHGKELGGLLREAISAGVDVRLLVWRNALTQPEEQLDDRIGMLRTLNATVNNRRGQAISDPLIRETGSLHQKAAFIRTANDAVAFVGGIDQLPSRWDDADHAPVNPDRPPGALWHDIHCRIHGKAVWDVFTNFRQRWNAATAAPGVANEDPSLTKLDIFKQKEMDAMPLELGTHAVQINRTLPSKLQGFANLVNPDLGEDSIRQSYLRVFEEARSFLYIEEQYFFNVEFARRLNERLRTGGLEFVFLVLPKELSEEKILDLALYAVRSHAVNMLIYGKEFIDSGEKGESLPGYVGDRVAVVNLVDTNRTPIYVHCKCIIADDLWMSIGSSNLNHRSMNYDAELNAASIDARIRRGAHVTPRSVRVELLAEHLRLSPEQRPLLEDPRDAFRLVKDVVGQKRPWMGNTHLIPHDTKFNHHGKQPPTYNQIFLDALALALDPDGEKLDVQIHLAELKNLLDSLKSGTDEATFGGLGTIQVKFDVGALQNPGQLRFFVSLWQVPDGGGVPPPEDFAKLGPFAPDQEPNLGIIAVGKKYGLAGQALDAGTPPKVSAVADAVELTASQFVNAQVLIFKP